MITEGHLNRHYQGRSGGRSPSLIDIAQDHALRILANGGVFELGVTFKGGTALRKFRAGNAGRFSTDLDFAATDQPRAELLLETLHGAELNGFGFAIEELNGWRRSLLHISTPFGTPEVPARIDCSPRDPWLPTDTLAPIPFPIHQRYGFTPAAVPVMAIEEVIAEKLARYRRASLARDLYDLAWIARSGPLNEPLIRRVTVLKVWHDVVEDKLGDRPFNPAVIIQDRPAASFDPEDIGLLTTPVDIVGWVRDIRTRYHFITDLDPDEQQIAVCNPGDAWAAAQLINALNAGL